jgi:adenosylmethionine-8-amino-7-oxononanoate aminotransferase
LGEASQGDTIGSARGSGIARFHAIFEPLLFDVIRVPIPDPRRLPRDTRSDGATARFLAEMEAQLAAHREEVAAVVIEPLVECAAGMVMHPPGYLRGVRELTKRFDVLLIADEIAVGMGRTGTMFACEQEGVVPDFLCLGKGLTGGYLPMSATLTHDAVYNAFLGEWHEGRTLHHGHTYSGNPLAAAAALATLDVFEEEQTLAKLPAKIARLGEHLCRLAEHPHVAETRQRGLIGALELTPDKASGVPYPVSERRAWRVCREALAHGVWIRPLGDVLYVMPPLAISVEELDELMDTLARAIDEVTR